MNVQEIINILLDKVTDIFINRFAIGRHLRRAELNLRLTFKHRLFHIQRNRSHNAIANIGILVVFIEKLLDGFRNMFLKSALVCTTLCGVLSVDKAMILFTILISVCESNLNIFAHNVDNGIQAIIGHGVVEQVFQAISALNAPPIIHNGETTIQISVVTQHGFNDVFVETIAFKECVIGHKINISAVFIVAIFCFIR